MQQRVVHSAFDRALTSDNTFSIFMWRTACFFGSVRASAAPVAHLGLQVRLNTQHSEQFLAFQQA
jgi:hypothetical protein